MKILKTKSNPLKPNIKLCVNPFVCVDDIVGHPVELNHVVFNPYTKDKKELRCSLFDKILSLFGYELTDEELDKLCSYDRYSTSEFTSDIRMILKNNSQFI